ncbi:MAG: electron transport protein SCO1/SenC, partial [Marinobacter sp. T13-3]
RYRTTFGYDEPDENGNYNVSHSSAVYVFDHKGQARLLLRPDLSPQQISEDLARLADQN